MVTSGIERIAPEGVVTRDGETHPADVIVYGTGFETTSFLAPIEIEGLGGRKLHEQWRDGAEAYLGVAVSGFPNLFLLYGPNTNLGHNSILFMIEAQVRYIVACVDELARSGRAWLDVRPRRSSPSTKKCRTRSPSTVWATSCGSWYKTASGKVTNNWKGFTLEYWWRMRRPDWSAFRLSPAGSSTGTRFSIADALPGACDSSSAMTAVCLRAVLPDLRDLQVLGPRSSARSGVGISLARIRRITGSRRQVRAELGLGANGGRCPRDPWRLGRAAAALPARRKGAKGSAFDCFVTSARILARIPVGSLAGSSASRLGARRLARSAGPRALAP